jgi:hypothetical protein
MARSEDTPVGLVRFYLVCRLTDCMRTLLPVPLKGVRKMEALLQNTPRELDPATTCEQASGPIRCVCQVI